MHIAMYVVSGIVLDWPLAPQAMLQGWGEGPHVITAATLQVGVISPDLATYV